MPAPPIYAVLTGDLVRSRRLKPDQLEQVRARLGEASQRVAAWRRGLCVGRLEFFRGDAWQLALARPGEALRVAVALRAALLADGQADTRVAIGVGPIEHLDRRRVSLSTGDAFVASGRGLDGLTELERMTIEIAPSIEPLGAWLRVAAQLCDAHIDQWTARQAEIAGLALEPPFATHEQIAARLEPPVTQQAVSKSLHGARFHAVQAAIEAFAKTAWETLLDAPHA